MKRVILFAGLWATGVATGILASYSIIQPQDRPIASASTARGIPLQSAALRSTLSARSAPQAPSTLDARASTTPRKWYEPYFIRPTYPPQIANP